MKGSFAVTNHNQVKGILVINPLGTPTRKEIRMPGMLTAQAQAFQQFDIQTPGFGRLIWQPDAAFTDSALSEAHRDSPHPQGPVAHVADLLACLAQTLSSERHLAVYDDILDPSWSTGRVVTLGNQLTVFFTVIDSAASGDRRLLNKLVPQSIAAIPGSPVGR